VLASLAWSLSNLKMTFNLCRGARSYDFHHFIFYGDDLMRIKIALVLTSAVFMMLWAKVLISFIFHPSIVLIDLLLSTISFLGSVFFLLEARKVLLRWYLAVPLCISLFLLVIVNFWIYFSGKPFHSDPFSISETLSIILLALLSPFSALVFLSMDRHPDSMNVYFAVSCVASMLSMIFLFFALRELSLSERGLTFDGVIPFQGFYWCFVMPIIGICFLVSAITYRNPRNIQSPLSVKPTQN
jgi:hypothetical protein